MKIKRNYTDCPGCNKKISLSTIQRHLNGKQCGKRLYAQYNDTKCNFCNKEILNKGSLIVHIKRCKLNPNRIPGKRSPNAGRQKGSTAWNKGLTAEDPRVQKLLNTKRENYITGRTVYTGRKHTEKSKELIRQSALRRHAEGWDNKAGRCKKYTYLSPIAGDITVDGTWELRVAKWLDSKNYNWKRNTQRFKYVHLNGRDAYYTPDFWVEELGGYLEVKGFETELDRCKWNQFKESLIVWKKEDIMSLK